MIDPFDNLRRSLRGAGPIPRPPSLTGTAPPGGLAPELPPRHSLESLFADPTNLPARALAILGEMERTKWPSPPTRLQLQRHTLGGGEVCSLPIRYFDARCLIATFRTDLDRATALLKGVGLDAVADGDGRATVLFGCFEYRDTDLGPRRGWPRRSFARKRRSGPGALRAAPSCDHGEDRPDWKRALGLPEIRRRHYPARRRQGVLYHPQRSRDRNDRRV